MAQARSFAEPNAAEEASCTMASLELGVPLPLCKASFFHGLPFARVLCMSGSQFPEEGVGFDMEGSTPQPRPRFRYIYLAVDLFIFISPLQYASVCVLCVYIYVYIYMWD